MFDTVPRPEFFVGPADFAILSGRTGREAMQGILDGEIPAPSMARTMNAWLHEVGDGQVEFRGEPGEEHMNPLGTVHGGWAMSLLDSVLGCAVHTTCAAGEGFVSMDTSVKFVRPILPSMGQVRAIATVQTRGRRIANAEGRIESRDGKVVALGTSTCFIQPIPG
ncbi:PaaI family thioesterase [Maritimibacter dapengensis]|uniref:PaaI family thioesterase n=1 Tax=Maritimibacter dapengensis TaxID=2836868 RepID=A0ABS6SZ77_9RHOB|nr:PaaI family thioesterase [Maritimibacter dapengensis]MBV7377823.1 PaaI family thioesterase [Maritimibacter dapengensis]